MMCQKVYSDTLPRFGVTSCLARRDILPHFGATSCLAHGDILPWQERNILPWQLRDILPRPLSPHACLLARQKPQRRHNAMYSKDPHGQKNAQNGPGTPPQSQSSPTTKRAKSSRKVTEARASAQRTKLDAQAESRRHMANDATRAKPAAGKREGGQAGNRRAATI